MDDSDISRQLVELPSWTRDGKSIVRKVEAESFLKGIELIAQVAQIAEAADHHPDIDIRWRRITFTLSTHSAGGLTERDFELAAGIEALLG